MQKEVYYSDDYAGIDAGNLKFYYGYEVVKKVDEEEEWCFQVKKDGKEVFKATTTDIEKSVKECPFRDVRDYLLAGISMWLLSK